MTGQKKAPLLEEDGNTHFRLRQGSRSRRRRTRGCRRPCWSYTGRSRRPSRAAGHTCPLGSLRAQTGSCRKPPQDGMSNLEKSEKKGQVGIKAESSPQQRKN